MAGGQGEGSLGRRGGGGYLPRRWRPEVRKTEARVEDGGPYIVLT